MKQKLEKSIGGLIVVGLPLLLVAGCAVDKAHLAQSDTQTQQADEQLKTLLDQAAVTAVENDDPHPEVSPEASPHETAMPEPALGQNNITESTPPPEETKIESVSAAQESTMTLTPPPQPFYVYFGFNQDEVAADDEDIVKQHAAYLLQHPHANLLITGHADTRGPKQYNQRLSEARARKVAQLLIAEGVPEQQLRVIALGDNVPMVDPSNHRQNRRVEFTYLDSMMAVRQ